jgi:hypothetical protein
MLDLCSDGEKQMMRDYFDFVLAEETEQLIVFVRRIKRNGEARAKFARRKAISESPNNVLPGAGGKMILKVQIVGIAVLPEDRTVAIGAVKIELQGHVGTTGEGPCPTGEHVRTTQRRLIIDGLGERRGKRNH